MLPAEVSVERLQDLAIPNKVVYYNDPVFEIFVAEINVGICRTVWGDMSKTHTDLRKTFAQES